ncbi:MAG: AsmA family protein, partial [Candidatus Eisenbacteria bacterium]|nr:AsmA family protein [Candidatus Eisenbacteria bacterium]
MSRTGKVVLIILAAVVALAVLVIALAPVLIPKDIVSEQITAYLERKLERPVTVESVGVRLFPRPEVSLRSVALGDTAAPGAPQLALAALDLEIKLWPLLKRRVEIVQITLDAPSVVMRLQDPAAADQPAAAPGPGAAQRATPPAESPAEEPGGSQPATSQPGSRRSSGEPQASPVDIHIEELVIRGGRADILHPDGRPFLHIAGFAEHLSAGAVREGDLHLSGETRIDTFLVHLPAGTFGRGMPLELRKRLAYDASADRLHIEEARLMLGDLPLEVQGTVDRAGGPAPEAHLQASGGPAEVASIAGYLPADLFPQMKRVSSEGVVSAAVSVDGPLTPPPAAEGTAPPPPNFKVTIELERGRLEHPLLGTPVEGIELRTVVDPESVRVERLAARMGNSRVAGRAAVGAYATDPHLTARAEMQLDLDELSPLLRTADSLKLEGRVTGRFEAQGRAEQPQQIRASGRLELSDVRAAAAGWPARLDDLDAVIRITDERIVLESTAGRFGSSDFRASGSLNGYRNLATAERAGGATVELDLRSRR